MSTPSGRSTCQILSSTGTSIPAPASGTFQAKGEGAAEVSERTTSRMKRRSAGRSTRHAPVIASGSTVAGTPSITTPRANTPAGGVTATPVRPWFSMSKQVSYSVTPVGWHQQVVPSFHTQARASSSRSRPPGTISAAGVTAGEWSVGGVKANSASVPFGRSSSPDRPAGGISSRRRLTIWGRRRLALMITTPPCWGSLPSTHANGTGTGPPKGMARAARIRTLPRTGGWSSTSHDSPSSMLPPPSPRRSIRRTARVPPAGGRSDHSRRSSVGSEKWTTTASSAEAPGVQEKVNDSVIRSSRTVSRTRVSASTGGRRSSRLAGAAIAPSSTGIQARMAALAVKPANRSGGAAGGGAGGSSSIVVSGGEVRARTAWPTVSPSRRSMSISAPVNGTSVVIPAR